MIADKMGYKEDGPPARRRLANSPPCAKSATTPNSPTWKRTTLNSIINNKGKTDWVADN